MAVFNPAGSKSAGFKPASLQAALIAVPLALVLASLPAHAAESREKQQLRRLQSQMQQLDAARQLAETERTTALADKEALEREVETLRVEHQAATQRLTSERDARVLADTAHATLQAEFTNLQKRLDELTQALYESETTLKASKQSLARLEASKKITESELAARGEKLQTCTTSNQQLAALGREMMGKYRDKSCFDALKETEPFTGVKKVEVENLLETWRDRVDAGALPADAPSVSAPQPAETLPLPSE